MDCASRWRGSERLAEWRNGSIFRNFLANAVDAAPGPRHDAPVRSRPTAGEVVMG